MQEIAHTDSYMLTVDTTKNRIYYTLTGKDKLPEISTFIHAWVEAMCLVSRGFTVLNDESQIQTFTLDWIVKSTWIHKMLSGTKLAGVAEVLSDRFAGKMRSSGVKKIFTDRNSAEAWLDKINADISG